LRRGTASAVSVYTRKAPLNSPPFFVAAIKTGAYRFISSPHADPAGKTPQISHSWPTPAPTKFRRHLAQKFLTIGFRASEHKFPLLVGTAVGQR
jgi:hypothetical protein